MFRKPVISNADMIGQILTLGWLNTRTAELILVTRTAKGGLLEALLQ